MRRHADADVYGLSGHPCDRSRRAIRARENHERAATRRHPPDAAMEQRLDRPRGARGARPLRRRAARARRAMVRPVAARDRLSELRVVEYRRAVALRFHRMQGAIPLPRLPRALRVREGALTPTTRAP